MSFLKRCALPLAVLSAASSLGSRAQAQQLRFSKTAAGGIASAGNTLGLSKQKSANGPGTWDSIGTFISLDPKAINDYPQNPQNPWPAGTTWDWTKDGSTAALSLPSGAEVLYAELVWGGSYGYVDDVSAYLDSSVSLSAGGETIQVAPDAATSQTLSGQAATGFTIAYYVRSAEVTGFIEKHQGGVYAVSGVPATANELENKLNAGGWTLVVAYRNDSQPFLRNLSLFVGGSFVDEHSQQDYALAGFCAPDVGPVAGRVTIGAMEGDANLVGDQLLIGKDAQSPFVNLSGPNNPENNFFCSQINGADGTLDTVGSFGTANADPFAGTNVAGGRQGWDLTTLPLSDQHGDLQNGQTSAVIRTNTTGDSYVPALVALELDVTAPNFSNSSTKADKSHVHEGDTFTVTATLSNSGQAPAEGLVFTMPLDPNLKLLSYQTGGKDGDADGMPVTAADLATGVNAGVLPALNGNRIVTMSFSVQGPPQMGQDFVFAPKWSHRFRVCPSDPPTTESHTPPSATVAYDEPVMGAGGAGGAGASVASSSSAGGAHSGAQSGAQSGAGGGVPGAGNNTQDIAEDGSCGCSVPGAPAPKGEALVALLALCAAPLLRKRHPRR